MRLVCEVLVSVSCVSRLPPVSFYRYCRKGRSEKSSGSEKTLPQMTSNVRRKSHTFAPQIPHICAANPSHLRRRWPHLRRRWPHLRRRFATFAPQIRHICAAHVPHLRRTFATSAPLPCAICGASMCDLHGVHDARRALHGGRPLPRCRAAVAGGSGRWQCTRGRGARTRASSNGGRSGGWQAAVRHDMVVTRRRRSSRDGGVE